MRMTGVAVICVLLMTSVVWASEPASLETPVAYAAEAQIDAAREAERQLEAALTEARRRRGNLERRSKGRTIVDVEDLEGDGRIVNGVATISFPNVGALLKGADPGVAGSWCTGTLIGCRLFLTANHCVEDNRDPSMYHVYLQNFGFAGVEWISPQHPDYAFPHADLAVLRLARGVEGVPIGTINRSFVVPQATVGTLVGFGRTGGLSEDYGIKRRGTVKTATCDRPETSLLCWDYDDPLGLPGTNSNTCNADSGGPLWVREAAGSSLSLAGVTSGGTRTDCLAGDHSYDVDVRQFASWIAQQGGADLRDTACGTRLPVGSSRVVVLGRGRELGIGEFQDYRFKVPPETSALVVAMNGTDDSKTNFGLFVRRGAPATATLNDCMQNGIGNYGACTFNDPAAGDWYLRVDQQGQGNAEFQAVVTIFPKP